MSGEEEGDDLRAVVQQSGHMSLVAETMLRATEEAELQAEIEAIKGDRIGQRTKSNYVGDLKRLTQWMAENRPQCLLPDGTINAAKVHEEPGHFLAYTAKRQTELSSDTLRGYRSAVHYHLLQNGITPSAAYQAEVSKFFSALPDRPRNQNSGRTQSGKESLPYDVYKALMALALRSDEEAYRFAHAYGVLQWNLMSRSGIVADLHISRITWADDNLLVYPATSETGMEGTNNPVHLYANPAEPAICPVTALSLYLLSAGPGKVVLGPEGKLFPGTAQAHRFGDILRRLLESKEMESILAAHGLAARDLGSHSFRKGVTTYVTSGSTAAPPFYAICQRALWKLGGVQDSYIRYERASDQYVGRCVAGLDLMNSSFSVLPPHFPTAPSTEEEEEIRLEQILQQTMQAAFSARLLSLASFVPVARMAIASVLHAYDWLSATRPSGAGLHLSKKAKVLASSVFTESYITRLRPYLISGMTSPHMRPTGIPSHIQQYTAVEETSVAIREMQERIAAVEKYLKDDLLSMLEDAMARTMHQAWQDQSWERGEVTPAMFKRLLAEHSQQLMLDFRNYHSELGETARRRLQEVEALRAEVNAVVHNERQPATREEVDVPRLAPHLSSDDAAVFQVPRCSVATGFRRWMLGEPMNNIPPYRFIRTRELPSKQAKELSEWRTLFEGKVILFLSHLGRFIASPQPDEVTAMWDAALPLFSIVGPSKRPVIDLSVSTVSRKFRKVSDTAVAELCAAARDAGASAE